MKTASRPLLALTSLACTLLAATILSARAQTVAPEPVQTAQAQTERTSNNRNLAQKVADFGLVPNPQPLIPRGLRRSANPSEEGRGVIGRDDRRRMTSRAYPWSAIGRLQSPVGQNQVSICTGSLIAPDVVLTNAHCVVDERTNQVRQNITFAPNLIDGAVVRPEDVAQVVDVLYGTDFRDGNAAPHPNDWAFAKLDRPLGTIYGTLAWTSLPLSQLVNRPYSGQLTLAGYSGDFPADNPGRTAGVHVGCSILGEVEGNIIHDCDTTGGSSGGPILAQINGEFRIVALNSAELTRTYEDGPGQRVREGVVNYGVKIDPIVAFIRQFAR